MILYRCNIKWNIWTGDARNDGDLFHCVKVTLRSYCDWLDRIWNGTCFNPISVHFHWNFLREICLTVVCFDSYWTYSDSHICSLVYATGIIFESYCSLCFISFISFLVSTCLILAQLLWVYYKIERTLKICTSDLMIVCEQVCHCIFRIRGISFL